jgi:hypothetical protein
MRKSILYFIFSALAIAGCSTSKGTKSSATADKDLEHLAQLMIGKFSSEAQSKKDTNYFNISLIMTPIWSERTDGKWLYVEQAMSSKLDKPYRQRVYHLQHPSQNTFTSDIYTLKDALSFAGLQDDKAKMDKLNFGVIDLKVGCTVTLTQQKNNYQGGTDTDKCPSELRGAKYATTKIALKKGELISWDQGFDAEGKQVWGATLGGYIFLKQ